MAAYPTLPTAYGSDPDVLSKLEIDRAEDGTGRARALHSTDKRKWKMEHPLLTGAQKVALDAHYSAERLNTFDYACPATNTTYSVLYARAPAYKIQPGGWYTATVELEQA